MAEETETTTAPEPATAVPEPTEEERKSTQNTQEEQKDAETATEDSEAPEEKKTQQRTIEKPIVSESKKTRPPYVFDKNKITLRFLFANRDGLTVTVQCDPTDTVGELKGALLSVWPEGMDKCEASEDLRLVCMGKGYLMPDSRTLHDCEIPVFKTHPTPINVSVKPKIKVVSTPKKKDGVPSQSAVGTNTASQGCCTIL